jgi:DNA-binding winged helix-turn-helix (wHTH) protein/Flp pilus assembly protein TadD
MASNDASEVIRVADLRVDPRTGELFTATTRVALPRKVADLLVALATCPGELVAREELYRRLWKGLAADYAKGLDTAVKNLRKAFLRAGVAGVSIETLPRRGYRLVIADGSAQSGRLSPACEADRLYLEGYHCWHKRTPSSIRNALNFFRQARDLDPRGARHHSAIAVTHLLLASTGDELPVELLSEAESAALEAIRLDHSDVTAYCVLGYIKGAFEYDLRHAIHDLARAVEMNPDVALSYIPYSYVLCAAGRFNEAREALEKARSLDPVSPTVNALLGFAAYLARDFDGALKLGRETLEFDPEFGLAHFYHGQPLLATGRFKEAIRHFENAVELLAGEAPARALLGVACALAGKTDRANEIDQQLDALADSGYADPYHRAILKHTLGFDDRATGLLEVASNCHCHWFALAAIDPKLDQFRDKACLKALLSRLRI